jgi:hypothetical protein
LGWEIVVGLAQAGKHAGIVPKEVGAAGGLLDSMRQITYQIDLPILSLLKLIPLLIVKPLCLRQSGYFSSNSLFWPFIHRLY